MGLISGDPSKDIFTQNPEIEYISAIKDFIKKHGGKKKASSLLWAIYMLESPSSEQFRRMSKAERAKEIAENYLGDKDFKWVTIDEIIEKYPELFLTVEEEFFQIWEEKIQDLKGYMKKIDVRSKTGSDEFMDFAVGLDKVVLAHDKAKKAVIDSNKKAKMYGDKIESLGESGII